MKQKKPIIFRIEPEDIEIVEKVKKIEARSWASLSHKALLDYCQKILQGKKEENGLAK